VVGEHGSSQVPLFSSVRVNGKSIEIGSDMKQRILLRIPDILKQLEDLRSGRTAGWTCAVGLAQIVEAVIKDTRTVFPCSAILNGEYDQQKISMAVPVVLGRNGIEEILEYKLATDEQEALDKSANKLKEACRFVDEFIR